MFPLNDILCALMEVFPSNCNISEMMQDSTDGDIETSSEQPNKINCTESKTDDSKNRTQLQVIVKIVILYQKLNKLINIVNSPQRITIQNISLLNCKKFKNIVDIVYNLFFSVNLPIHWMLTIESNDDRVVITVVNNITKQIIIEKINRFLLDNYA